jgi:hypothetical protein
MSLVKRERAFAPELMTVILGFAISYKSILSLLLEHLTPEFMLQLYDYYSNYGELYIKLEVNQAGIPYQHYEVMRPKIFKDRIFHLCQANPRLWKEMVNKLRTLPIKSIVPPLSWHPHWECPPLLLYEVGDIIVLSDPHIMTNPQLHFQRKGLVVRVSDFTLDVALFQCVKGEETWHPLYSARKTYIVTTRFDTTVSMVTITNENVHLLNPCRRKKNKYYSKTTDVESRDLNDDGSVTVVTTETFENR